MIENVCDTPEASVGFEGEMEPFVAVVVIVYVTVTLVVRFVSTVHPV